MSVGIVHKQTYLVRVHCVLVCMYSVCMYVCVVYVYVYVLCMQVSNTINILYVLSTDASAIPSPLSGNIQATVQAVAHQAADIILTSTH